MDKQDWSEELTKEMFMEWKRHPVTVVFFNIVKFGRDLAQEDLCKGYVLDSHPGTTVQNVARKIGIYETADYLLNMSYADMKEYVEDSKAFRGLERERRE